MIGTEHAQRAHVVMTPAWTPTGCQVVRRMQPHLGTYVEVAVRSDREALAERAIDSAFETLRQAQRRWSFHDPVSELSQLNRSPGRRVALSPASLRLLRLAHALMVTSQGAFDVTVGGALVASGHLPDHGVGPLLERGTAADLVFGPGWAQLERPVRITLDGIAKGFAVDLAVGALRRSGLLAGWVNAGGDLRAFGDLTLPVQLRDGGGRLTNVGGLRNLAIASSWVRDEDASDRDAFSGRIVGSASLPAADGMWSVLARSAWRADALTKVAACAHAGHRGAAVARLGGRLVELGG